MNPDKLRERIHAGIDHHCAPLTADPYRVQRVLTAAKQEGEQVVKKKLSVTFVLIVVMLFCAAAALALVTIQETGRLFSQTEQTMGDYITWPAEKKALIVTDLMDEGYIQETPERTQLRESTLAQDESARIADEAIAAFTGEDARYASFLSIMNAAWGPFEQWSQAQKAWYSQVLTDTGAPLEGKTYYVEAAEGLSEQEAIAIAKSEISRGFGMDESLLEQYRIYDVSLQIPESAEEGSGKAYWHIAMDTLQTELEERDDLPFQFIDVFVDPDTGKLLEPIEDKAAALKAAEAAQTHPLFLTIQAFEASINEPKAFHTWTLEHKARWSQEIAPDIRKYASENGGEAPFALGSEMKISIAYTYGLPDEKAIVQEKALEIAREALTAAYHLSNEELSLLMDSGLSFDAPALFYDVTDARQPKWKIIFTMPSVYCADDAVAARVMTLYGAGTDHNQFYLVEINAYTEAVIRTLAAPTFQSILADF